MANYSTFDSVDYARVDYIDLRSDTVTLPGEAMKQSMLSAHLGDDVYGEDASVNRLEAYGAELFDKPAALFVTSGTQSNLLATLAHCQRGEEILVGSDYHVYIHEAHGASVLGGLALYPVETDSRGALSAAAVVRAIKPDDFHCPVSRLLCLENTVSGHVQAQSNIDALCDTAKAHGLSVHMDGARIFNAHIALKLPVARITANCDSVSVCLSKGLGAPVGTLLIGERAFIDRARRLRKMLGGGMRQAGVLAACGLYALEHNIARLEQDHLHARQLAQGLEAIPQLGVDYAPSQTNMVFIDCPESSREALHTHLYANNILIEAPGKQTRLVCHLDISAEDIQRVIDTFNAFFEALDSP